MHITKHQYPRPLYAFCSTSNSKVGLLLKHANFINQLQSELHKYLGQPLNAHCKIANYKKDTLILHADSPGWAAKLRYMTPDILGLMHQQFKLTDIKTIRVKVAPDSRKTFKTSKKPVTLSSKSAKLVNDVANTISDHALKTSLLKISRHNQSG